MTHLWNALAKPVGRCLIAIVCLLLASLPALAIGTKNVSFGETLLEVAAALIFLMGLPLLIGRFVLHEAPADYGFRFPEKGTHALRRTVLVLAPLIIVIMLAAQLPEFREYYARPEVLGAGALIALFLLPLFHYLAEEFLFRGFLLQPLWKTHRYFGAGLTLILFTALHAGKPALELAFAALIGVLLTWLSLRTRSFVPAAIVHFAIAVLLNALVTFA